MMSSFTSKISLAAVAVVVPIALQGCKKNNPRYHGKYGITMQNHGYSMHMVTVEIGSGDKTQKMPLIFDTGSGPLFVKGSGEHSYKGQCLASDGGDAPHEKMCFVDGTGFEASRCESNSAEVTFTPYGKKGMIPKTTPVFYKTLDESELSADMSKATHKFFSDKQVSGILGAGWSQPDCINPEDPHFVKSAFDSMLQDVIKNQDSDEKPQLKRMFGVQMCPAKHNYAGSKNKAGGFVSFGHSDNDMYRGNVQTVPVQKEGCDAKGFWCVEIERIDILEKPEPDYNASVTIGMMVTLEDGNEAEIRAFLNADEEEHDKFWLGHLDEKRQPVMLNKQQIAEHNEANEENKTPSDRSLDVKLYRTTDGDVLKRSQFSTPATVANTIVTVTKTDLYEGQDREMARSKCQSMVDTGNDVGITFVEQAYKKIYDAYQSNGGCPAEASVDSSPTMQITFSNGVVLKVPPSAMFLWKDGKDCQYRLGKQKGNNSLGQAFLSAYYTEFTRLTDNCDDENDCTLGFAPIAGCARHDLSDGK